MSFSIVSIMFLMLPWFLGHLVCIIMDGTYIGEWEQTIVNIVGAFSAPEQYGLWSVMTSSYQVFTDTFARIFLWDYSMFEGDYSILRWIILVVLTIPFILALVFGMKYLLQGIFNPTS